MHCTVALPRAEAAGGNAHDIDTKMFDMTTVLPSLLIGRNDV